MAFARFPAIELPRAVGCNGGDGLRKSDGQAGHLCHGPYITLGPGRYAAGFYLQRGDKGEGEFEIEACTEHGRRTFAKRSAPVAELFTSIAGLQHLDFALDRVERGCELRLWVPAGVEIAVREAVLFRTDLDNWGPR